MKNPLISVIVPVYKVELYIDKCISSIINQTYKNIEVIIVDDGSPDNCPQICDSWAKKDPRIKVVHKNNGGLSSARNVGISICKGDYIGFVDSDDWLEPQMYEHLLNACLENDATIAIGGRWDIYEVNNRKLLGKCPTKKEVLSSEETLKKVFVGNGCDSSVWDKLFHRSLWDDIAFPEGKLYEDVAIIYKIILKAEKTVLCPIPLYNYNHRQDSIVTSDFNSKLVDYPNNTAELLSYIERLHPSLQEYALWTHLKAIQHLLTKICGLSNLNYKKYSHLYDQYLIDIKKYRAVWEKSSVFSKKDLKYFYVLMNKNFARISFRARKIIKVIVEKLLKNRYKR